MAIMGWIRTLVAGALCAAVWFDAQGKSPQFPFGFGLSYTTFAYSALETYHADTIHVRFALRNTGQRAGAEVAQVYLQFPAQAGEPPRRLAAWKRVELQPGEIQRVSVTLEPLAMSIWDVKSQTWRVPDGEYKVYVGSSSRDLPLSDIIRVNSGRR